MLQTDTLARRPAGEGPDANLDQSFTTEPICSGSRLGRPDDRADEFWHEARRQISAEGADAMLKWEGGPKGRADEHCHRDARLAKASNKP